MHGRFLTGAVNQYRQPYTTYISHLVIEQYVKNIEERRFVYQDSDIKSPTSSQSDGLPFPEPEFTGVTFRWNKDLTKIVDFEKKDISDLSGEKSQWTIFTRDPYNGQRRHVFIGTLVSFERLEKEELKEEIPASISDTGLVSTFACLKLNCEDAIVIIKQDDKRVADIFITKEKRRAKVHVYDRDAKAIAKQTPDLAELYTPNNTFDMDVTVVQARPGFSRVRIRYQDIINLEGELLYDGGICTSLYFVSRFHGGHYCLAGNNQRTGLIINYSTLVSDRRYNADIFMLEQDSMYYDILENKVEDPSDIKTRVNRKTNDIIKQLVPDFERESVQEVARSMWLHGGQNSQGMKDFLSYHHAAVTGEVPYLSTNLDLFKVQDFRVVLDIIKKHNFPKVIIFKTLAESEFNRFAVSHKGAVGLWQFMGPTAEDYGLSSEQRTDVVRSTEAAMRYMRDLFTGKYSRPWRGDIKLAIAAYNWGQGNLGKTIEGNKVDIASQERTRGRPLSIQDTMRISAGLSSQFENGERNMFWVLKDLGALPGESVQHVLRVVSAIMVGLSPEDFGYEDVVSFPTTE